MSKNFEKDIQDLQKIIETMESGSLSLDESMKAFKDGVNKIQKCQKTISEAEQTILELTKDNQLQAFNADDTNS